MLEARYLLNLERERPDEFRKLMRRRVERKFGVGDEDGELAQLARTVVQLKEMGLINGLGGGGNESWIKDAIDGLRLLVRFQQPAPTAESTPPANGVVRVAEVPAVSPALPNGSATAVATAPPPAAPTVEAKMTPASAFLIGQLEQKSPAEAAEWLVSQNRAEAQQFVARLCSTPDAEHGAMLDRLALEVPDIAAFVVWVRQRPDLLAATVQELRIRTQQFPPLHPTQNVGM